MSRGILLLVLAVCVLVNAGFALLMFSMGMWPVGLVNSASAAFSLYVLLGIVY